MTAERAKEILATYKLPMTAIQMAEFKQALALLSGQWGRAV